MELINHSDRTFTDISSEEMRSYMLQNGQQLQILNPQWLSVSDSGHHYIVGPDNVVYCIAPGWMALSWIPKAGAPHFVA